MKLLPKELIRIEPSYDGVHIIASLYEHPVGYCWCDVSPENSNTAI
jgi:hypothetical protein